VANLFDNYPGLSGNLEDRPGGTILGGYAFSRRVGASSAQFFGDVLYGTQDQGAGVACYYILTGYLTGTNDFRALLKLWVGGALSGSPEMSLYARAQTAGGVLPSAAYELRYQLGVGLLVIRINPTGPQTDIGSPVALSAVDLAELEWSDDGAADPTFTAKVGGTVVGTWHDTNSGQLAAGGRLGIKIYNPGGAVYSGVGLRALRITPLSGPTVACTVDTPSIPVGGTGQATGTILSGVPVYTGNPAVLTVTSGNGQYTGAGPGLAGVTVTSSVFATESATSSPVTVTSTPTFTGGTISPGTIGSASMALTSSSSPANGSGTVAVSWEYSTVANSGPWQSWAGVATLGLAISGLIPATTYYVRRKATDSNTSVYSNALTVTTLGRPTVGRPTGRFDQTTIRPSIATPTGGKAPLSIEWVKSRVNGDLHPSQGGSGVVVAGQATTDCVDTPSRSELDASGILYYSAWVRDADGTLGRSDGDYEGMLADHPSVFLVTNGTSLMHTPATGPLIEPQTDPRSASYAAARSLESCRGIRWVDVLNCAQGASSSADWLPTAGTGVNIASTNLNYFNWMMGKVAAKAAALGRSPTAFLLVHETNDGATDPATYRANMQAQIDAIHAVYPDAIIYLGYAPFNHLADDGTVRPTSNDHITLLHAQTEALAAAHPAYVRVVGRDVTRESARHREMRDQTTLPQPAQQIHYGDAGCELYGRMYGQDIAADLDGDAGTPGTATGYQLYFPSAVAGVQTQGIAFLTGGGALGSDLVIAPTGGSGITLPSTITITAGQVRAFFNFTVAAAGIQTVGASHTGPGGVADPGSASVVASAAPTALTLSQFQAGLAAFDPLLKVRPSSYEADSGWSYLRAIGDATIIPPNVLASGTNTVDLGIDLGPDALGLSLVVYDGTGENQWRVITGYGAVTVNNATRYRVTVDRPWAIPPDTTSVILTSPEPYMKRIDLNQPLSDTAGATLGGAFVGAWASAFGNVVKNRVQKILRVFGPFSTVTPVATFGLDDGNDPASRTKQ
jgi:hypothetical protein